MRVIDLAPESAPNQTAYFTRLATDGVDVLQKISETPVDEKGDARACW